MSLATFFVFHQHIPFWPLRTVLPTRSTSLAGMMVFSASHSARFRDPQYTKDESNFAYQPSPRDHWVRRGVSAHGEIWSANFEQRLEQEGFSLKSNTWNRVQAVEGVERDVESEDEGLGASEHASTSSHAPESTSVAVHAVVSSSPPPPSSSSSSPNMAYKSPLWISAWFALSIPVIFWDAGYCLMRPRSMRGGDLHWIWSPYSLYQDVDYVYGIPALERGDGFTNAQSVLNLVENFLNIWYLYLAHAQGSAVAPLVGFASVIMTLSKTVLYLLVEYFCGQCSTGHNDLATLFWLWIVPNGLWILFPSACLYYFGGTLANTLRRAEKGNKKKAQ